MKLRLMILGLLAFTVSAYAQTGGTDASAPPPEQKPEEPRKRSELVPTMVDGTVIEMPDATRVILAELTQPTRRILVSLTPDTKIDGKKKGYQPLAVGDLISARVYESGDTLVANSIERLKVYSVPPRGVPYRDPAKASKPKLQRFRGTIVRAPSPEDATLTLKVGKKDVKVELPPEVQVLENGKPAEATQIQANRSATVRGTPKEDGTVVAQRVELRGSARSARAEQRRPSGVIEEITADKRALRVKGEDGTFTVLADQAEVQDPKGGKLAFDALQVGDRISLQGSRNGSDFKAVTIVKES